MGYEYVNHPNHYNNYSIEVIDMMVKLYGKEVVILFCEMNAFKYRMRLGLKPENEIEQDLKKEQWYLNKAKSLKTE
jgi:isoprenylcysteine carboxyl methyltransferase (ICMT) family protein YpbQ